MTGTILINEPPERVWPIMVNPFEFQGEILPRMKTVEVMVDRSNLSILKVTLDMSFLFRISLMLLSPTTKTARRFCSIALVECSEILKALGKWHL